MSELLSNIAKEFGISILLDSPHSEHENANFVRNNGDDFEAVMNNFARNFSYDCIIFGKLCILRKKWDKDIDFVPDIYFDDVFLRLDYICKQFMTIGFQEMDTVFPKPPPGKGWLESVRAKLGEESGMSSQVSISDLDDEQFEMLEVILRYGINKKINYIFRIFRYLKMVRNKQVRLNKWKVSRNSPEIYALVGEFRKVGSKCDLLFSNSFTFDAQGGSMGNNGESGFGRLNALGMIDDDIADKFFSKLTKEPYLIKAKKFCACGAKKISLGELFADIDSDSLNDISVWASDNVKKLEKEDFEKLVDFLFDYQLVRQENNKYILRMKYLDRKEFRALDLTEALNNVVPKCMRNLLIDSINKKKLDKSKRPPSERTKGFRSEYSNTRRIVWDLYVEKMCNSLGDLESTEGNVLNKDGVLVEKLPAIAKGSIAVIFLLSMIFDLLVLMIDFSVDYSWMNDLKNYKIRITPGSNSLVFTVEIMGGEKLLLSTPLNYN